MFDFNKNYELCKDTEKGTLHTQKQSVVTVFQRFR